MFFIGQLVGSVLGVFLLYALWEFVLFKRVMDNPLIGKIASVAAAYVSASVVAGFGMADGGPYFWGAFLTYLPGAVVVGIFAVRRAKAMAREMPEELQKTFE